MTGPTMGWKTRNLLIVGLLAVPGVLMFFQRQSHLWDRLATGVANVDGEKVVAPDFNLLDLGGESRRLSDFRGRVVLLNFWATWCPPCRDELAALETLYQAFKDQGLVVLAVSSDVQGEAIVRPFAAQHDLHLPILLDPTAQIRQLYGVTSLPTTYVLDRQGRLVTVSIRSRNWADATTRALIRSLLGGSEQTAIEQEADAVRVWSGVPEPLTGRSFP